MTSSRVCEWCSTSIPETALKCSHCQKWRKDIDEDRIKSYCWGGVAFFLMAFLFMGIRNEWWHTKPLLGTHHFSFDIFLKTPSGIGMLIGLCITGYLSWLYYSRVSKKIGTWWWV